MTAVAHSEKKASRDLFGATLAPELVMLPFAVSFRQYPKLGLALLAGLLLLSLIRKQKPVGRLNLLPASLMMLSAAIVLWRGPYLLVSIYLMAGLILLSASRRVSRATAYTSLLAGVSLYLCANVAGWLAGFHSTAAATRVGGYETGASVFGARIFFPFTTSINEPAYIAGAFISAVAAMLTLHMKVKWYHVAGAVSGALIIVASNTRAAAVVTIAVIVMAVAAQGLLRRSGPFALALGMLAPFLLPIFKPVLESTVAVISAFTFFVRDSSGLEKLGSLESREGIWENGVDYWTSAINGLDLLFGFGYLGHVPSGAWVAFASGGQVDYLGSRTALTAHNSLLQTLFDGGLVGAAAFVVAITYVVFRFSKSRDLLPMFVIALILGLSGVTEVATAPGFGATPFFLLLYLAVFPPPSGNCSAEWAEPPDEEQHDGGRLPANLVSPDTRAQKGGPA
jgi:hypothetical protein